MGIFGVNDNRSLVLKPQSVTILESSSFHRNVHPQPPEWGLRPTKNPPPLGVGITARLGNNNCHHHHHQQQQRWFASNMRRRSPYVVLGLSKERHPVTQDTIKAAFRKLAKVYHPDLNRDTSSADDCEAKMAELVEAYERLTRKNADEDDDDFLENIRVGTSNKVALACELFSVDELIRDTVHEVHALRMQYGEGEEAQRVESVEGNAPINQEHTHNVTEDFNTLPEAFASATRLIPMQAHPGDSVSDFKERLESEFGEAWGLEDTLGWELVAAKRHDRRSRKTKNDKSNNDEEEDEDPTTVAANNEILSYHLFLEDYQIRHGDTLYVVVRKRED
jgi:hypothetical protein